MSIATIFLPIALALTPASAPVSDRPEPQARIPFVNHGSVRNFRPVGDDVVYLQDTRRNWYRADLAVPCFNLRSSIRIGVDTRFGGTLDSTSSFIVNGERCPIRSLVRSSERR